MRVTLAGPGAGKTTELIRQIKEAILELNFNRELAVISYTNASADDIKIRLSKEIDIPQNVFVGTIHSFMMRYYLKPYGGELGYKTANITIVDKLDDTGIDWVDAWVKKKVSDPQSRKQRAKSIIQGIRKRTLNAAAKKGVYTYDSIMKYSSDLSQKAYITKLVSNKIQFLFIDEYQDISKYGHEIVKRIHNQNKTEISVVGDPDQSIYHFRYGQSQIGEKAPAKGKQPLREFTDEEDMDIQKLTVNHRSSKEIVTFNNRYGTIEDQSSELGNLCSVQFMNATNPKTIVNLFLTSGSKYNCESYMLMAKKRCDVDILSRWMTSGEHQDIPAVISTKKISDYIVAQSGLSYQQFCEKNQINRYQLKRLAVSVRNEMENYQLSENGILRFVKREAFSLFHIDLEFTDLVCSEQGKSNKYNFEIDVSSKEYRDFKEGIRCMTIHKAKGLEADAGLVLAETSKQFLKWINMTHTNMKSDVDEDYRLGYVAFTRAKKLLMLACKEPVDVNDIKRNIRLELEIIE